MPEVEYTNWFQRVGKAFGAVVIGILMFFGSFFLLAWNEGRAVHRAQTIGDGAKVCISVPADKVDDANDGKLVHVSGKATTDETLTDPQFGVSAKALKLNRHVEIYQWVETSKEVSEKNAVGGKLTKTTSYYHEKQWVINPQDSSKFHKDDSEGPLKGTVPQNFGTLPYTDASERAKEVKVGAFKITSAQVDKIGAGDKLIVTADMAKSLPAEQQGKVVVKDGDFYKPFAGDSNSTSSEPQIGDVRISFKELKPQDISIIAKQFKGSFEPWPSPSGTGSLDELSTGIKSKEAMFQQAIDDNNAMTWILRLVGFIVMAIGIFLIFNPIAVFVDFLPFIGDLLGAGIAVFAVLVALPLTLITISLAWVVYRPIIGIPLLAGGIIILVLGVMMGRSRRIAKRDARDRGY